MKQPKSIRFSTLETKHGPLKLATDCSESEWEKAHLERRFFTVYHAENDHCTPVAGLIGHHGCVNTICKVVFTKPVKSSVKAVTGMRHNDSAFAICNPD